MILSVLVIPNASKTEIVGWVGDSVKIRLAAPPVDGKANQALIQFLQKLLRVSKEEIELVRGHAGKRKIVNISMAIEDLKSAINIAIGTG